MVEERERSEAEKVAQSRKQLGLRAEEGDLILSISSFHLPLLFLFLHATYTIHSTMADILTQLQTCLDQVTLSLRSLNHTQSNTVQLATQFYATIGYLTTYHDNSPADPPPASSTTTPQNPSAIAPALARIPKNSPAPPVPAGAPVASSSSPPPGHSPPPPQQQQQQKQGSQTPAPVADPALPPAPDSPRTFASRQRELARDLVIKEQQIEYLISVLPGIDSSEAQQGGRIRELEGELRGVEKRRDEKVGELRDARRRLEKVLGVVEWGVFRERFQS